MCNVALSDDVDTPITIMRQWLGPSLLTNGSDYIITGDTLHINQLSVSLDNNRNITCQITVIPSAGYPYVLQNSVNGSTQLSVEGEAHSLVEDNNDFKILLFVALNGNLFTPDVIIPGAPTAGDEFNITCRLDGVVERFVGMQAVSLSFSNTPGMPGQQSQDGLAYSRSFFFNPVTSGDIGTYTCIATVISSSGSAFVSSSSETLQIKSQ